MKRLSFTLWSALCVIVASAVASVWLVSQDRPAVRTTGFAYGVAGLAAFFFAVAPYLVSAFISEGKYARVHWLTWAEPWSPNQTVMFNLKSVHPHQMDSVRCVVTTPPGIEHVAQEELPVTELVPFRGNVWFTFPEDFGADGPVEKGEYAFVWYGRNGPECKWVRLGRGTENVALSDGVDG